ncbi:hypothetical protein AAG906_041133 [Vitis piasezkii]
MKAYLRGLGLWQWVETERQIQPLGNNPTLNQIRDHEEEEANAPRALSYIHVVVWDKLKEMYLGSDRTRQMQILNLKRQFEVLRMKDNESIKEYVDRLMEVVNKIQLLGKDLTDQRVIEKVLVSLPERFESKISSLEDSKDLTKISLDELVQAFQAQEQRRSMRQKDNNEEAFLTKNNPVRRKIKRRMRAKEGKVVAKRDILHVLTARGKVIQRIFVEKVCKNKNDQQGKQAQMAENYHATNSYTETWLIDSGCTNHMTPELSYFRELDRSYKSKVKIGNGNLVNVKGKGVVVVETPTCIKYISDVLFVPEISQSLLSVG